MLTAVVKIIFLFFWGRRARWDCASASHDDRRSNEIEHFFFHLQMTRRPLMSRNLHVVQFCRCNISGTQEATCTCFGMFTVEHRHANAVKMRSWLESSTLVHIFFRSHVIGWRPHSTRRALCRRKTCSTTGSVLPSADG